MKCRTPRARLHRCCAEHRANLSLPPSFPLRSSYAAAQQKAGLPALNFSKLRADYAGNDTIRGTATINTAAIPPHHPPAAFPASLPGTASAAYPGSIPQVIRNDPEEMHKVL